MEYFLLIQPYYSVHNLINGGCMAGKSFFSGNAMYVIGAILVAIILWVIYQIGGVALSRWFG
jgi:hypothetical protein